MDLAQKKCIACSSDMPPLNAVESNVLLQQIPGWTLSENAKKISKQFKFKNFVDAMEFANKITPLAEAEGHHPDLKIGWGKVIVELTTHAMKGLSENDFIMAAKVEEIFPQ